MKKPFLSVVCSLLFFCFSSFAQSNDVIRVSPCDNQSVQKQADSIKHLLENGGFSVLREASITMESEYEIPIIVPMNEGISYQFVFIGDTKSNLYEVRMYDYNEKQVVYQKKRGNVNDNIISYSYIPKMSEYHMIKPLQVNSKQKKDLCGYVMLFSKSEARDKKAR
ncbi:hypothetical protein [Agriterribacter sp.]|uniref:hypothetical protein n=1 Tax=Agriterribacter sp. TaxID=2821509 RepID=UPI002BD59E30|nr:hypothetical protein [Agriterribacter sp.]HRP56625.1 hypothetical protein [Agriterribacter sp.]